MANTMIDADFDAAFGITASAHGAQYKGQFDIGDTVYYTPEYTNKTTYVQNPYTVKEFTLKAIDVGAGVIKFVDSTGTTASDGSTTAKNCIRYTIVPVNGGKALADIPDVFTTDLTGVKALVGSDAGGWV